MHMYTFSCHWYCILQLVHCKNWYSIPPSFSLPPFPSLFFPSSFLFSPPFLPPFFSLPPFSLLSPSFLPPHRRSRTPISFLPTPCHSLLQYLSPNYLTRPLKYSLLLLRSDTRANLPERLLSNRSCRRKRCSAWTLPRLYIT